jgi:hypothetical protein
MVGCMLVEAGARFTLARETLHAWRVTFLTESTALLAFGVAWIVAGKYIPAFVDADEELHLFR